MLKGQRQRNAEVACNLTLFRIKNPFTSVFPFLFLQNRFHLKKSYLINALNVANCLIFLYTLEKNVIACTKNVSHCCIMLLPEYSSKDAWSSFVLVRGYEKFYCTNFDHLVLMMASQTVYINLITNLQ